MSVFARFNPRSVNSLNISNSRRTASPPTSQLVNGFRGSYMGSINTPNRRAELPDATRGHGGRAPFYSRRAGIYQDSIRGLMDMYSNREVQAINQQATNRRAPSVYHQSQEGPTAQAVNQDVSTPHSPVTTLTGAADSINRRHAGPIQEETTQDAKYTPRRGIQPITTPEMEASPVEDIPDTPLYATVTPSMTREERIQAVRDRFIELWTGG